VAVGWLLVLLAASQIGLDGLLEGGAAGLRDPEYYRKLARLRARRAAFPGRPLLVAFGSSRVGMGLRPDALDDYGANSAEPLVFNFGVIGAGPGMQRLMLERLLRDGARPDAVLLEFWPPYFTEYPPLFEEARLDANRLAHADLATAARLTSDPGLFSHRWRLARLAPSYAHRFLFMNLALPTWLPWELRQDMCWGALDAWGWRPSVHGPEKPELRPLRIDLVKQYYVPCLAAGGPRSLAVRAFEEMLDLCEREHIPAVVAWLPEASEFRAFYPPAVERWAGDLFAGFGAHAGARPLDARGWVPDGQLLDCFHLSPGGAATFTRRLRRDLLPTLAPIVSVR
jgi:hypothetical protein